MGPAETRAAAEDPMKDGFARVASCGGIRMVNATLGIDAVMILVGAYRRVMGHESIHLR